MENQDLFDLTAADAARQIRDGAVSPVALLEACLDRIDACEPEIRAWVHVDRKGAMRAARERTWEAEQGRWAGALHGVPVAIKDIIDVAGIPTTAGAGPFAHRAPDAALSRLLRVSTERNEPQVGAVGSQVIASHYVAVPGKVIEDLLPHRHVRFHSDQAWAVAIDGKPLQCDRLVQLDVHRQEIDHRDPAALQHVVERRRIRPHRLDLHAAGRAHEACVG